MSIIIPPFINKQWKKVSDWLRKNPIEIELDMKIDREVFFSNYKQEFGNIKNQKTVDTINSILDKSEERDTPINHLAYIFATSYHEARDLNNPHDFYPVIERGSYKYITDQYWYNTRVRGWLGNKSIQDAWEFRGRGLVQLTGRINYERFNLENNPDQALDPKTAVDIMFEGMLRGIFTGKALNEYLNNKTKDYYNARRIINGVDKAELIASYARRFEDIIKKSNRKYGRQVNVQS